MLTIKIVINERVIRHFKAVNITLDVGGMPKNNIHTYRVSNLLTKQVLTFKQKYDKVKGADALSSKILRSKRWK